MNPSTTKVIKNLEASSTRLIKKWLNLPKSATQAILYHPDVLNIPQVNTIRLKAKISYLSAILNSPDPLINELHVLLNNSKVQSNLDVSNICRQFVDSAPDKIASIPLVKKKCVTAVNNYVKKQWDEHLSTLEVQGKFGEIVSLESENKTWKKIMLHGLPYGQLSFILKAGSDTLPHPLNLRRLKIQCDSKCPLCQSLRPTTAHILNGCPIALDQGRYTWRHDSILKKILQGIIPLLCSDSKLYADIDQWRAEDTPPSTIPPNILSTLSRPDIVIVHSRSKQIHLLELTIPTNSQKGLDQARERKLNKPEYNYRFRSYWMESILRYY